jgi:hypothetical protein
LKDPGLKLGVEKFRVEMSFNCKEWHEYKKKLAKVEGKLAHKQ